MRYLLVLLPFFVLYVQRGTAADGSCESRLSGPVQAVAAVLERGLDQQVIADETLRQFFANEIWGNPFEPGLAARHGPMFFRAFAKANAELPIPQRGNVKRRVLRYMDARNSALSMSRDANINTFPIFMPKKLSGTIAENIQQVFLPDPEQPAQELDFELFNRRENEGIVATTTPVAFTAGGRSLGAAVMFDRNHFVYYLAIQDMATGARVHTTGRYRETTAPLRSVSIQDVPYVYQSVQAARFGEGGGEYAVYLMNALEDKNIRLASVGWETDLSIFSHQDYQYAIWGSSAGFVVMNLITGVRVETKLEHPNITNLELFAHDNNVFVRISYLQAPAEIYQLFQAP